MPAIILEDETLHVQPLHPRTDRVARLYGGLGHGYFPHARTATNRLDAKAAGRILGLFEAKKQTTIFGTERDTVVLALASHADILGLTRYRFALKDVRKVVVGEHFPELSIEVRGPSYFRETYDLTPDLPSFFAGPAPTEAIAFCRGIADLFDAAMTNEWVGEWVSGWLDTVAVEWEPVDDFPGDTVPTPGYRTSPRQGNRIIAERDAGGLFERLARSFIPGAKRSPGRAVLTQGEIYADFGGQVFVLPRGLAVREQGNALIFGRFAGMVLEPRATPCPVAKALRDAVK